VKAHRQQFMSQGFKPTSIGHKLTIIRRFYHAAVSAGLRPDKLAVGIRPPRDKRAVEDFGYLSEGELLLLRELPPPADVKDRRDRALLGLLALHGPRTVEIERANTSDVQTKGETTSLLVRGKGQDHEQVRPRRRSREEQPGPGGAGGVVNRSPADRSQK
jgi:site-specific recombinase XerD